MLLTIVGWLPYNDQALTHFDYLKRQFDKIDRRGRQRLTQSMPD